MKKVLPINAYDVLAHEKRVLNLTFLSGSEISSAMRSVSSGSNAYAIAPSRSTSKNAVLLANPHSPWSEFYLFFEADLSAPGLHAYGAALVGQPMLNIAFNESLGWTHTVNTIDGTDRYELTLKDSGYLLDDKIESFQKKKLHSEYCRRMAVINSKILNLNVPNTAR